MMLLSDLETAVRQDLFDPSTPSQRWLNSDIDRGIDKALDRYTAYYPNVVFADMATQQYQRTYPYPVSWNAQYPVLWIERIIYPLQVYGSYFLPPSVAPTLLATGGTGLSTGQYQYAVSYLSQGGETPPSPIASVTTTINNGQVTLSGIPVGPALTVTPTIATNTIIGRNLYRTLDNGTTLYLLATIGDNTTTTYLDSAADSALAGKPQPPTLNTSGVMYYPPIERDFAEYSNLYDSNVAMAAGGNMGVGGAVGTDLSPSGTASPSFTLKLGPGQLPQDNTLLMRIFYATKHQLDNQGSTVPEIHRDILALGAVAYCMEAYQIPTNDNFDFQDGGLRDRVDDTKIPASWLKAAQNKMAQFLQRLEEMKQARDFASSARVKWGDVPFRWNRL